MVLCFFLLQLRSSQDPGNWGLHLNEALDWAKRRRNLTDYSQSQLAKFLNFD